MGYFIKSVHSNSKIPKSNIGEVHNRLRTKYWEKEDLRVSRFPSCEDNGDASVTEILEHNFFEVTEDELGHLELSYPLNKSICEEEILKGIADLLTGAMEFAGEEYERWLLSFHGDEMKLYFPHKVVWRTSHPSKEEITTEYVSVAEASL